MESFCDLQPDYRDLSEVKRDPITGELRNDEPSKGYGIKI